MSRRTWSHPIFVIVLTGLLGSSGRASDVRAGENDSKPFELRDGDRVVLIGNTFIEREQSYSYLETLLRTRRPERKITFRNLGWSGDTVFGHARGYEHGADRGFARLNEIVHGLKPTVIFVGYGMGESFDGPAGLASFRQGLERMLDMLKDLDARTVLIGPIRHENLGPPMPDPAEHNRALRQYADAMADVANARGHRFIDLYALLHAGDGPRLTDDGIHLTQYGYWRAAGVIARALKVPSSNELLPPPPDPSRAAAVAAGDSRTRTIEKIRELAILKNIQYFNQWRPANEPYIFGFRKAEQSRNQVELPRFSQSIDQLEDEMSKLCHPRAIPHERKPK